MNRENIEDLLRINKEQLNLDYEEFEDDDMDKEIEMVIDCIKANSKNPKKQKKYEQILKFLQERKELISYLKKHVEIKNLVMINPCGINQRDASNKLSYEELELLIQQRKTEYMENYEEYKNIEVEIASLQKEMENEVFKEKKVQADSIKNKYNLLIEIRDLIQLREQVQISSQIKLVEGEIDDLKECLEIRTEREAQQKLQEILVEIGKIPASKPKKIRETQEKEQKIRKLIDLYQKISFGKVQQNSILEQELKQLLEDQEIMGGLEEAQQETEQVIAKISRLRADQHQTKASLQKTLSQLNRITEIYGIIKQQQQSLNHDQNLNQYNKFNDDNFGEKQIAQLPEEQQKILVSTPLEQNIQDARLLAAYTLSAPESVEKHIFQLIYILYKKQEGNITEKYDETLKIQTDQYDNFIIILLEKIKKLFNQDEFYGPEIIQRINQVQEPLDTPGKYLEVIKQLKAIIPLILKFNFQEFFAYMDKVEEAALQLNEKDILLLLGTTGAGKSTTVHYLCGSEMIKVNINGLQHITFGKVINQDLNLVKVSPFSRSETRYIRPITIDKKDLGERYSEKIILVDTPGLFDLGSAEIDVSNQLGIVRGLNQAAHVQPVIVLSYLKLGSKGENFKETINFYAQMITDMDYIEYFNFFFTHVPKEIGQKEISATIDDYLDKLNAQDKTNNRLVQILKVISIKGQQNKLHILNPLDRGSLLPLLNSVTSSKKIPQPSEVFQNIIQQESHQIVREQFALHEKQIIHAFQRAEHLHCEFKLTELLRFCQILKSDDYKGIYLSLLQKLNQNLQKNFDDLILVIERQMQSANTMGQAEIALLKNNLQFAQSVDSIRFKFIEQFEDEKQIQFKAPSYQELLIRVQQIVEAVYEDQNFKNQRLDNNQMHEYFFKLNLLAQSEVKELKEVREKIFLQFKDRIQNASKISIQLLEKLVTLQLDQQLKEEVKNDDKIKMQIEVGQNQQNQDLQSQIQCTNEEFAQLLNEISKAALLTKDEEQKMLIQSILSEIQDHFIKKFNQLTTQYFQGLYTIKIESVQMIANCEDEELDRLVSLSITPQLVKQIQQIIILIENFKNALNQKIGNKQYLDFLDKQFSTICDSLIFWYCVSEEKIKRKVKKEKKYSSIKKVYNEIMLIQDLPFIQSQTIFRYNRMKMNLQSLVESKQLEANGYLKQIQEFFIKDSEGKRASSQISYYQLVQLRDAIRTIKELKWTIQDGGKTFYNELKDSLKNELSNLIEVIHQNVSQSRQENPGKNNIKEVDQAFHQIFEIKNIANILQIPLENFKIDDFKPEIEENLRAAEKFLNKKQIKIQEDQAKAHIFQIESESSTQNHLLKRSECERLDNLFTYLSQIKSKEIMLKSFDNISLNLLNNDEKSPKKTLVQRVKCLSQQMDEFINNQMEYIRKDFEYNLQKVKEYSENDQYHNFNQFEKVNEQQHDAAIQLNNDFLVRPIENLSDRFKMIKELKTRFPYLWQKLSRNEDYDDEFRTMISNFFLDLEQQIAITQGDAVIFFKNLRILKHLIPLDGYVHDDGQRIFQTKYDLYFKRMCEFSGQVILDSEKCMMENNYEEIKSILKTLTKLGDSDALANIQRIQQKLKLTCKTLTQSVKKQSNSLIGNHKVDPQKAENLNETVQQLQDLLFNFDHMVLDKYFEDATAQLKIFNDKMRKDFTVVQKSIENSIQNSRFTEAQNQIDNYFKILNALNYSSMNQVQEQTFAEQQTLELSSLQDKFNQALENLEKEFDYETVMCDGLQNVNLSQLMDKKPRDILENLQKGINQQHYPFYNQFKHIENKLDEAFSTKKQFILDSLYKGKSGKECMQLINEVTRTVNMLPENLREKFKNEFEGLKTTYQELQQQESKQIQSVIDKPNNDINAIKTEVLNSKFSLDEECKIKLNKYYETLTHKIFDLIKSSDLKEVLEVKLPELWNFQNPDLNKYIKDLAQKDQDKIKDLLKQIFEEIIQKITSLFKERKEGKYFPSKIKEVSQYSKDDQFGNTIMQFFQFNKTHEHILNEIIPNMQSQFNNVINEAKEELKETDSKFQEAIHSKQQGKIQEAFDIIIHSRKADIATDFLQSKQFNQEFKPMAQKQNYDDFLKIAEVTKKQKLCEQVIPILKKTCEEIKNVEIINPQTRNNKKEREIFYNDFKNNIQIMQDSIILEEDLKEMNYDPIQVTKECNAQNQEKISKVIKDAQFKAENIGNSSTDLISLGIEIANLKCIQEISSSNQNFQSNKNQIAQINNKVQENIDEIKKKQVEDIKSNNIDTKEISKNLIQLQAIAQNIEEFKDSAKNSLKNVLDIMEENIDDESGLLPLIFLNLQKCPEGQQLIDTELIFISQARAIWATKFNNQGIDYVLNNLLTNDGKKITEKERQTLLKLYQQFEKEYQKLVEENIVPINDALKNLQNVKTKVIDLTQPCKNGQIDIVQKGAIPLIMAHLFAIWTIQDSYNIFQKMNKKGKNKDGIKYLLKPHAAQVISIFRILGCGFENIVSQDESKLEQLKKNQIKMKLKNQNTMFDNLVQIKTGEGKSITLAIVSSIFALWGFEVSCACYSEYLSKRDYKAFTQLFEFLNIKSMIFYGTFNVICEKHINKDGKIRDLVLSKILKENAQIICKKEIEVPKILLIDEVDVFFSKEFYNKLYVPMAQIKHPNVSALLDYLFENKNQKFNFKFLRATQQYKDCASLFKPEYLKLLDQACQDILFDAREFLNHSYIVQDGKIGYKDQDQISFTKSYGYKTIFAHYHHSQADAKEKVTIQNLENSKAIGIHCGQFSYAEIPHNFMLILGVTGTLDVLSDQENKIIKEIFQIKNFTFSPSVFGKNNLLWKDLDQNRIMIRNEFEFYNEIINEINAKMVGNNGGKRSVIVFFKTLEKLKIFEISEQFKKLHHFKPYQILTEQCDDNEKESIIAKATYSQMITLSTASFVRGTDFICRDKEVETNGGVHVISTFVSELMSEFVQIQGRTARQGNKGSFQMILLDSDLSEFDIDVESEEYKSHRGDWLQYIENKRDIKMKALQKDDTDTVRQIKQMHKNSLKIKDHLISGNPSFTKNISEYLVKINQGPPVIGMSKPVKTMILMDATGSMSSLLNKAKNSVGEMYDRAGKILEDHQLEASLNMIQYVCYRNYSNKPSELLEYSPWESKPQNLRQFMEKITAHGGYGNNEAVEIGFEHAVNEADNCGEVPLHQIFLIGDAPPNTREEVDSKRGSNSDKWKGSKFETPIYWETQLDKLISKNIPVHTFYVLDRDYIKASFKEIADRSSAQSHFLNVTKDNSHELLLGMFIPIILDKIGKESGDEQLGKKMAQEYMNIYK